MVFPLVASKDILKDCVSKDFYKVLWKKKSSVFKEENHATLFDGISVK